MSEPRAYTPDEVRTKLLEHFKALVDYWGNPQYGDERRRMEGLVFSICTALDGCSMGLPAFLVTPMPHEDDEAYHRDQGENWFPTDQPDLGMLHDHINDVFGGGPESMAKKGGSK